MIDESGGGAASIGVREPGAERWSARASVSRIRVALVDDHHLVLEGLRLVLEGEPDLEVVGDASTEAEAFDLVASTGPDVLLLDLTFPEGDGLPLLQALHARHPLLRIIVLTVLRGPETVRQAMLAGASGYVVKGARSRELFEAIRAVSRGERYLHSSVTAAIIDDSIHWLRMGGPVSAREREVLALLAAGHSATAIGQTLGISVHTVRRHVANLSAKLGLHGTTALTLYAIQNGFVRDL
jgi:DNA-binding NarL/FixJ family response regulator